MNRFRPLLLPGICFLIIAAAACVRTPMVPEDPDSDEEPGDEDSVIVNLFPDHEAPADLLQNRNIIILERWDER